MDDSRVEVSYQQPVVGKNRNYSITGWRGVLSCVTVGQLRQKVCLLTHSAFFFFFYKHFFLKTDGEEVPRVCRPDGPNKTTGAIKLNYKTSVCVWSRVFEVSDHCARQNQLLFTKTRAITHTHTHTNSSARGEMMSLAGHVSPPLIKN